MIASYLSLIYMGRPLGLSRARFASLLAVVDDVKETLQNTSSRDDPRARVASKDKRHNILYLSPTLSGGGAENVTSLLADALGEFHNTYIFLAHDVRSYPTSTQVVLSGTNRYASLADTIQRYEIDTIIACAHWELYELLDLHYLGLCYPDLRLIVHYHNMPLFDLYIGDMQKYALLLAIYKEVDLLVALSSADASFFTRYGIHATFLPNPISLRAGYTASAPASFALSGRDKDSFIFIGDSTRWQKNFRQLATALRLALEKNKDLELVILDSIKPALTRLLKREGIEHICRRVGRVEDVAPYLAHACAILVPSHFEGFSLALLEAKLTSTIAVISHMPYIALYDVAGNIVARDAHSLASIILRLSLDSAYREEAYSAAKKGARSIDAMYKEARLIDSWRMIVEGESSASSTRAQHASQTLQSWYIDEEKRLRLPSLDRRIKRGVAMLLEMAFNLMYANR